ncbi:PQQ-binding-like beta-propeller repeat protein [Nocardia sp. NPDC127579]|uniref:outer membrane protein assembly factor BamB family protein n=1 Tax=Nocardia sp. NPDC127579 TaxID=3345402 RepID=UPI003642C888
MTTTARVSTVDPNWKSNEATGSVSEIFVAGNTVLTQRPDAVVALGREWGRPLWQRADRNPYSDTQVQVSGSLAVLIDSAPGQAGQLEFEVIDVETGRMVWQGNASGVDVYETAIYLRDCGETCTTMRHDIRDGRPTWPRSIPGHLDSRPSGFDFGPALPETPYLAFAPPSPPLSSTVWTRLEPSTGAVRPAYAANYGWGALSVGDLLIVPDFDLHVEDGECPLALQAYDGHTGSVLYTSTLYSGFLPKNNCDGRRTWRMIDGDDDSGTRLRTVTGSRMAAVDAAGAAQLFDLVTGRPVWQSGIRGTPYDVDDRSVVVVERGGVAGFALLDVETGEHQRSVPLSDLSPSRLDLVGDRVVVDGTSGDGSSRVDVYDRTTGRVLASYRGQLLGAGPDWLATKHGGVLEFHHT